MRWRILLSAALTALVLSSFYLIMTRSDRVLGRVYVDGLAIGGWPRHQAAAALRRRAAHYRTRPFILYHRAFAWRLTPGEVGAIIDWRTPLAEALAVGRRGWLGTRLLAMVGTYARPYHLGLRVHLPDQTLADALQRRVAPAVEWLPRNAYFDLENGRIVPERDGRRIDLVHTCLRIRRTVLAWTGRRAGIILATVRPRTTARDLSRLRLRHVLSSYTTTLDGSPPDRLANIALGAAQLNGTIVTADRTFSFNQTTGPRDAAHGYRRAPEIIGRELRPGIGGGICQVATTLYNAVLLAGLPVRDRSCHSLPPKYVPLGRDATVYYPWLDFRFVNATVGRLMILAGVTGRALQVRLLGEDPGPDRVSVISRILAEFDPPVVAPDDPRATENTEGAPGYRVRVLRLFGDPASPARVEVVSEDLYRPVPRVQWQPANTAVTLD